jgi:hypothetical protein
MKSSRPVRLEDPCRNSSAGEGIHLENCSKKDAKRGYTAGRWQLCRTRLKSRTALALLGTAWLSAAILAQGQTAGPRPELFLPDTPQPQAPAGAVTPAAQPCPAGRKAGSAAATAGTTVNAGNAPTGANRQSGPQVNAPQAVGTQTAGLQPASSPPAACPPQPEINWYARFVNGPQVKPMTPKEKAWLAARNVVGPFNALTILASSAIAVGSDAHSAYGPGMAGFGRSVGVSYTQDITGEFFGVFLIPSIAHQDPHYHRLLKASIPHRVGHAMLQVLWTEGDNGKGMVNYANIVGFAIDDEIGNLYVPGQQTNLPASAARYATGLALAPVGNFVSEFWPDVASHIHVRVVMIQWIVNHVGKSGSSGSF